MSDLRLNLDTTNFKELVDLGRSLIPTVAPGWTDHNIHDPGIMLMELMAWVADAEIYALSRTSRTEREAYGHLLGLKLTGPRPARGLIWPDAADLPAGAPAPWLPGVVIDVRARVAGDRPQAPPFFTTRRIELSAAALTQVATEFADGSIRDWTRSNSQQGATFLPFGSRPQKNDTLRLTLTGTLIAAAAPGAPLSVGFEIPQDLAAEEDRDCNPVHLVASLSDADGPWPVSVLEDTTGGLSHSGVILLDVDRALAGRSGVFTLSIRSAAGAFLLPPRVQRIALNVLPIEQVEKTFDSVPFFGTNTPGQTYTLRRGDSDVTRKPGLLYPVNDSFSVQLSGGGSALLPWTPVDDLDDAAPDAAVYTLDERTTTLSFGNGVNGRQPVQGATLRVDYDMTSGARGNLPRGIRWTIAGIAGPFGVNSEVTSGGADATDLAALRANARQRVHGTRPIVTTTDLRNAALAFVDLDVRRAEELPASTGAPRVSGRRVLVAVGPHDGSDAGAFEESPLWLGEIRRRLRPRLPLGQGLDVIGPRLIDIRVVAHLVAGPQVDPARLRVEIQRVLRAKLAITTTDGTAVWPFGRDVTAVTVKGWLRNIDGVARVMSAALIAPSSPDERDRIELTATALPRVQVESGDLTIDRAPVGGRA